jgi:hypothetical protein
MHERLPTLKCDSLSDPFSHLEPLRTVDSVDPLPVGRAAFAAEQHGEPTPSPTAALRCQLAQARRDRLVIALVAPIAVSKCPFFMGPYAA